MVTVAESGTMILAQLVDLLQLDAEIKLQSTKFRLND